MHVRSMLCAVLSHSGYVVLEAANGQEAFAVVAACQKPIALIITDITMPGISGYKLAQEMVKLHPSMRTILMSGYADQGTLLEHTLHRRHFLQKPFLPDDIIALVRKALDEPIHPRLSSAGESP